MALIVQNSSFGGLGAFLGIDYMTVLKNSGNLSKKQKRNPLLMNQIKLMNSFGNANIAVISAY